MPQPRKTDPEPTTATTVGSDPSVEEPSEGARSPVFTVEAMTTGNGIPLVGPVHEAAGAFTGVDPDTEVTVSDAKKRIKDWLKADVEQPPTETEE